MAWSDWATAVLVGVGAPVDKTNVDTLWAWSGAESLPRDRMSWNNPLNATWYMPGAEPMNWIPVWAYANEQDGITATISTLLGGPGWPNPPPPYYYPIILDHLRRSVPRSQWQDACPNLGTWGTGCGWLSAAYTAAPITLSSGGFGTMDDQAILDQFNAVSVKASAIGGALQAQGNVIIGLIKGLPATNNSLDLSAELAALATANGKLDQVLADEVALKAKLDKDLA